MTEPLDVSDFRDLTRTITKDVEALNVSPRLTLVGYEVGNVEIIVACAGEDGVVLSVDDTKVSLSKPQLNVLKILLDAFSDDP